MCGHVGIAGHLEYKDEMTLKRMLVYDYFRGPDSTGVAVLKKNGDSKVAKIASNPIDLFDMKRFSDIVKGYESQVFLGHNRAATKGAVNNYNAHPYEFGHIVGAHNGTLDKKSWEKMEELAGQAYPVDSMAVFAAIEKVGIDEVVPHLQGAWALVWYDLSNGTLNFIRNKERPLWYAYQKDFKKVFWASEHHMIDTATKQSLTAYDLHSSEEGFVFFSFKEDWLYTFELDKLKAGSTERPKPRLKELKGKAPTPVAVANGWSPFHHGSGTGTKTTGQGSRQGHSNTSNVPDVFHLPHDTQPLAGYMTKDEFNALAKYGCAWCQKGVEYEDEGIEVNLVYEYVKCCDCAGGADDHSRIFVTEGDIEQWSKAA